MTKTRSVLYAFLLMLFCAITAQAQSTNVSGTITSSDSQAWAFGSYRIEFYPGPAIGPFFWNGAQLSPSTSFAGSLDGAGSFTGVSVPSSDKIGPAGTKWRFTVCPAANSACYFTLITITGASQNVTSAIIPPPLSVVANNYNQPTAYADTEIVGANPGFMYYNLTLNANRQCQGPLPCTWVTIGGGGGGSPASPPPCVQLNISSAFGTVPGFCFDVAPNPTLFTIPVSTNIQGSGQFKGNNPYADITLYNARAVAPTSNTCTISSTSTTCVLAADPGFVNGDGVRINGAGATNALSTPGAPTVTPSLAQDAMETGNVVASAAGSTSYSYTIVARDKNGGLTAQSSAGTTSTGQAALGATTITNSTLVRSNNVVTVTTAAPHNILVGCTTVGLNCPSVYVQNSTDASFSGYFLVTSATDSTHYTYTQGLDTRAGSPVNSATGGTTTVYASNHIVMPALGSAYQYYICKSGTLVGAARPGETVWDDYGVAAPPLPDFVPTTCPSVATNDYLVTTIVSGAGTTSLTLANAAINSVTSATIKKDDGPTILAAATAAATSGTAGPLRIPSTGGQCFTINSHTILPSIITVQLAGCLTLNETLELGSQETWTGVMGGSSNSTPQFAWGPGRVINVGTAYPGIAAFNGEGTYRDITILVPNQGLGMTVGPATSTGFNNTFEHTSCSSGASGIDILGQCLVLYGTSGAVFKETGWFTSGPATNGISTAGIILFRNDLTNVNGSGNFHFYHPFFTSRGVVWESNPVIGGSNKAIFDQCDSQGIRTPTLTVGKYNAPLVYFNGCVNDTSPEPFLANLGSGGMQATLINVTGLGGEAGGIPGFVSGNAIPGLTVNASNVPVGQNVNILQSQTNVQLDVPPFGLGFYQSNYFNAPFHSSAGFPLYFDMPLVTGVTATVAAGGSATIANWNFKIVTVDANGGKSAPSAASSTCTTTSGNQTCNVAWTPVTGAQGYYVYGTFAGGFVGVTACFPVTVASCSFTGSRNAIAIPVGSGAGTTGIYPTQIWTPKIILTGPLSGGTSPTCTITTTSNTCTGGAGSFYQTLLNNGVAQTQEPAFDLIAGTNMTITCVDSATVKSACTFISSSSAATAFSALTAATNTNSGTFTASGNAWDFSAASSFKLPSVGAIFPGSGSGNVTLIAASAAGTPTVTFGTSSGTPAVTASSPLAITTATGNITCATCATTTSGGALSATAPITISSGGLIAINAATTGALGSIELTGNLGGTGASPTVIATTITGFTQNLIVKFNSTGNLVNSTASDTGSLYTIPETLDLTSAAIVSEIANAGSTGTTIHKLASLTGAPSTAVITTAASTSGVVGIVVGGAGTTSNAQVATDGQATCVFDGGTTAGDYVQISASVNGDCTDAGSTLPSSGQIIGVVLSTNASGGTYNTFLFGPAALGSSGGGGSGTVNNCATSGALARYPSTGTAVSCLASLTSSAGNISIGIAGTTGGTLQLSGSTSGTITIQPQNAAGTFNFNLPITAGTSTFVLTSGGGVSAPMTWTSPTITVDGQSCTLAGSCTTISLQTNGGANTSQNLADFRTSTGNVIGLTNTPSNPSGGRELFEITGTLTPTGGGTGLSAPTAHSLLVTEGASNMALITSPVTNGFYACGFNVVASAAVDPSCNLVGVPVDAQTGTTYTIGTVDRAGVITASNSGAQTYTAVNPTTAGFTSNFPYVIKNISTGTVTETSSGFNVGGGTSLLIPPSWTAFHWSDNTNYIVSRLPDFGAFPNSSANAALTFNSATGVFGSLSNIVNCSPTRAGDLGYWNGSVWTCLAGNNSGTNFLQETSSGVPSWQPVSGVGTVTSVALTVNATSPSGIFTVTGSPVTTSGTLNFNLAGTSGGIPYFSSASVLSSSAALTANAVVVGGGAGTTPSTISASTTTTNALFATAGAPAFRNIANSDLPGTGSITINTVTCTLGSSCTLTLDLIGAAAAPVTFANGVNTLTFNNATTASGAVGVTFGETTASTSAGSPYEVEVKTLIGSTATPLKVDNSLNGSQTLAAFSVLPTWNTTGVVAGAIFVNVTNTASGTGSKLIDLQVGGTSQFKVDKAGNGTFNASITGTSLSVTGAATAGQLNLTETTAPSGASSTDICYGDSTLHGIKCSFNNGSFLNAPLETGTMTSGHVVSVNSTTNLLQDGGAVAANLVVASSPGAGVAHFAGSTQTVTSSAVTSADATGNTSGSGNFCLVTSCTMVTPALGTPASATLTNATGLPTAGLVNNAVTSAKMAVANTYRTCDIPVGDTSASAITNAQLGPQSRICFIPAAATIVEMDVNADAGTPNVIVGRNRAGSIVNIVSGALATAASGGIACSNTGGTTGLNGATTCSSTLQNTGLNAGDYLELVSGTAGGTAKFFVVHVTYTVN